jgi:elongation factor G
MPYTTRDIRNLALVVQAGAGKTLLAEALLAQSGAIRSKGSLARGTTVCDFDPQEKALLHSLDAAICGFETQGKRVNVIDTPGYPDFMGRTLSALEAVETAVIVASAVNGVETMTQRMMDFAKQRGLCRLIVVNKIDSREARTEAVLAEVRETFGRACLPLNHPAERGAAVVDCFFQPDGKPTDPRTPRQTKEGWKLSRIERSAGFTLEEMKKKLELKKSGQCQCQDKDILCKTMCGTLLAPSARDYGEP